MKGSCLCGAVAFEVDQLDMPITHCHCMTCQKAHAAASTPVAGVLREHFRWLRGVECLKAFESSPGKLRHFCTQCGTHLVSERPVQPHIVLRVATLDEDPGTIPALHIWCSHERSWVQSSGAVPHHDEWSPAG